jgi:hypothetical protein
VNVPDAVPSFFTLQRNDAGETVEFAYLALVPVQHPWEVFEKLKFGDFNDCPPTALLTAIFREWHGKYGAVPVVVTHDVIECLVARPPQTEADSTCLAMEQFVVCEDIVVQGVQSVRNLAQVLWRAPSWYFWWD